MSYRLHHILYLVFLAAFLSLTGSHSFASEFTGVVVGVADGDTLTVVTSEKERIRVRLDQIDAPEKSQPFGERSRQSLAGMSFQKTVRVVDHGDDRYGRTIGTVFVDGLNINEEQIRRGMAWVFVRYAREDRLFAIEQEAKQADRGLWTDAEPVPPWEWRRRQARR